MTLETTITLAVACFVLMAAPGPGTMATVGRGLAQGFAGTLAFILGIVAGDLVYLFLAVLGLAAVASQFGEVLVVVRWLGAVYLVYLGIKAWRAPAKPIDDVTVEGGSAARDFLGGLALTLGNPKVVLIYTALLPSFVDLGSLGAPDVFVVAVIVSGVLFGVMAGYAFLAARARRLFRSGRAVRWLNRASGGVLVGVGAAIVVKG